MSPSKRTADFGALLIILLVGVFFLLTIRPGQGWPDDFAAYIHHARNLAEGKSYSDIGYLYNPHSPEYGPRTVPPVIPLLLVPICKLFPLSPTLIPMKVEMILFFLAFLVVLHFSFRDRMSQVYDWALVAVLGFNPVFWTLKDSIVSDVPFAFLLYLTLFVVDRKLVRDETTPGNAGLAVLAGLLVYICYGARIVGVVLVPVLLLVGILRGTKGGRYCFLAAAVATVLIAVQAAILPGERSYFDPFHVSGRSLAGNIIFYPRALSMMWDDAGGKVLRYILFLLLLPFATLGVVRKISKSISAYEIFAALCLGILIVWPWPAGIRYLVPIVPLYVAYSWEGIRDSALLGRIGLDRWVLGAVLFLVGITYVANYSRQYYGPIRDGILDPQTGALFQYIRTQTSPSDVFIFRRPRALALFTNRRSSVYFESRSDSELFEYFSEIHARYLIEAPTIDDPYFLAFIRRHPNELQSVYSNPEFRVYKLALVPTAKAR